MRTSLRSLVCLAALVGADPSAAFDCAKATTAAEKAICADPAARAGDAAMAAAFVALEASMSPAGRPALLAAQARWLRDRDNLCGDDKGPKLNSSINRILARA